MRKTIPYLLVLLMVLNLSHTTLAKRGEPKAVPPVTRDGVTYSAPHDHMGCVVAKSEKKDDVIWTKQVYVIKYDLDLERDVQDCFIAEIKFVDDNLIITNERGDEYQLNPITLAVKVLKGSDVLEKAKKN